MSAKLVEGGRMGGNIATTQRRYQPLRQRPVLPAYRSVQLSAKNRLSRVSMNLTTLRRKVVRRRRTGATGARERRTYAFAGTGYFQGSNYGTPDTAAMTGLRAELIAQSIESHKEAGLIGRF